MSRERNIRIPDENSGNTTIDFSVPFDNEPVRYAIGGGVDRENFTSFLIFSFSISRGVLEAQTTFFDWVVENHQPDLVQTLADFRSQGYLNALSVDERGTLVNAYNRVKKHNKEYDTAEKVEQALNDELEAVVHTYLVRKHFAYEDGLPKEQEGVSFEQLMQSIAVIIEDVNSDISE